MGRRLLKCLDFTADALASVTISDTSKIEIVGRHLVLLASTDYLGTGYPTNETPYAETALYSPGALIAWHALQVFRSEPEDIEGNAVTDVRLRLSDGTDHYYWTGAAWAITTTEWNTVEDACDNFSSWTGPVAFVVGLRTTDGDYSPSVTAIKFLYEVAVPSMLEDWIYRTIVPELEEGLRPETDFTITGPGGSTIDLDNFPLEGGLQLLDVVSVWDHTSDPDHLADLFLSYDSGTREITLSQPITAGNVVWIRGPYQPTVAVTTSQDYDEIASAPAVELDFDIVSDAEAAADDYIMDEFADPPTAVILPAPRRVDIELTLSVTAGLAIDLVRLVEEVIRFCQENKVLASRSTLERATFRLSDAMTWPKAPNLSDVQAASVLIRMDNVHLWTRDAYDADAASGVGFGVEALVATAQIGPVTRTIEIGGG
jgi:hypothetical protein